MTMGRRNYHAMASSYCCLITDIFYTCSSLAQNIKYMDGSFSNQVSVPQSVFAPPICRGWLVDNPGDMPQAPPENHSQGTAGSAKPANLPTAPLVFFFPVLSIWAVVPRH